MISQQNPNFDSHKAENASHASKKFKSDPDDIDENHIIPENSLQGLPFDCIEEIMGYLDLNDKKSMSQTCKKINGVFGDVNLSQLWCKVDDVQVLTKSKRKYPNIVWCKELSSSIWSQVATTLTCLKVDGLTVDDSSLAIATILSLTKLQQLDFTDVSDDLYYEEAPPVSLETVPALKELKFLRISYSVLKFFNNRAIKISSEKLITIILVEPRKWENSVQTLEVAGNCFRELISEQRNLTVLHLDVCAELFSHRVNTQSKLRELRVFQEFNRLTPNTRTNFNDFVNGQEWLQVLSIDDCQCFEGVIMTTTLPRLKIFEIEFFDTDHIYDTSSDLEGFLNQNKTIRNLHMKFEEGNIGLITEMSDFEQLVTTVTTALTTLDDVKIISISSGCKNIAEVSDYPCPYVCFYHGIISAIKEHAKPEFVFRSPWLTVFKRSDDKMFRKLNHAWIAVTDNCFAI